jgi:endonuclease/exonuclease/phosphatase family metal-dependent hydrolase
MDSQVSAAETTGNRLHWTATVALLVAVIIEGILWTLSRVFVLNFDIAGPNPTALLSLSVVSGWSLVVLARIEPPTASVYTACSVGVVVGFAVSLLASPLVAGLGGTVLVTAATPPLAGLCCQLRERVVGGVAGGLLLAVGIRAYLGTTSPYATTVGTGLFGVVVIALAVALVGISRRRQLPATEWNAVGATPAPLFVLILVGVGYLAYPWTVARWALRPLAPTLAAMVVGIVAGVGLVAARGAVHGREQVLWSVLFLSSVAVLLYGSHPLTTTGLAVAWTSAIVLLAAGVRQPPAAAAGEGARRSVGTTAGLQFLAFLGIFLSVSATHWAFMPTPLDLMRGLGTEVLLALHAVFPLAVALTSHQQSGPTPSLQNSRRSVLASIPTAVLPLGGFLLGRSERGVEGPRDGSRVRVMTYNLHLFFGEDGKYNLTGLRELIEADGADIVAVCESDALKPMVGQADGLRWLGQQLGYHVVFGAESRARSEGVGLLSRWPVEAVEVIELPIEQSVTRLAVVARVQTPAGSLPVISTHLSVGSESESADARAEQVATIVDRGTNFEQAVVMGDFNTAPDEPEYEPLAEAFTDAWLAAEQTRGTAETWSASDPQKRIDYIFLRGEWTVHEAATKGTAQESDHKAVVAEIERPADPE